VQPVLPPQNTSPASPTRLPLPSTRITDIIGSTLADRAVRVVDVGGGIADERRAAVRGRLRGQRVAIGVIGVLGRGNCVAAAVLRHNRTRLVVDVSADAGARTGTVHGHCRCRIKRRAGVRRAKIKLRGVGHVAIGVELIFAHRIAAESAQCGAHPKLRDWKRCNSRATAGVRGVVAWPSGPCRVTHATSCPH
jgi:hypothetical protein